jgi:hypothetical protein
MQKNGRERGNSERMIKNDPVCKAGKDEQESPQRAGCKGPPHMDALSGCQDNGKQKKI